MSNVLGRKGSIVSGLVLEIIGRIIQTSAYSPGQYVAGRFVAGIGNGYAGSTRIELVERTNVNSHLQLHSVRCPCMAR